MDVKNQQFTVGKGKVFVSGLHWQALSASDYKSEGHELAKQLSFDLAIWRTSGAVQVGYAASADGYRQGMLSAAAVISKTIEVESDERDFLCAVPIGDGQRFLYVSQADGVIVPHGDLIGTPEEVRARLLGDMSVGKKWGMVIAPLLWGIDNSTERTFDDFIPRKHGKLDFSHGWWALQPVSTSVSGVIKTSMIAGFVALFAISCMLGVKYWHRKIMAEEAAQAAALAPPTAPKVIIHPWKNLVGATEAATACLQLFNDSKLNLWPGNWSPITVGCNFTEGTMTVSWKAKAHGWIRHLLDVVPTASVVPDGNAASATYPLALSPQARDEQLEPEAKRISQMKIAAQELGTKVVVSAPQAPAVLPGAAATDAAPLPWRELKWSVADAKISPDAILAGLDGPGLRVTSISAAFKGGVLTWNTEGVQYVLP